MSLDSGTDSEWVQGCESTKDNLPGIILYRGTSLKTNSGRLGPFSRPMLRPLC